MAYTTIDNPELYFQVKTYSGNGSTQSITFDGDEDMSPDLVWIKSRSRTDKHTAWDSVRTAGNCLFPSENNADESQGTGVTAFGSDGFSLGAMNDVNYSSATFVAWAWKESADAGFDIVSFTGSGSTKTESHSLSAKPNYMIFKNRATTDAWTVYSDKIGATHGSFLNQNNAWEDSTSPFNDTEPTSSVFTVGGGAGTNGNGNAMIAYCFAEKQGYSKFGSYTGNGNANGTYVHLGFTPAFLLIKNASATSDWNMRDSKRGDWTPGNTRTWILLANTTASEQTHSTYAIDLLSNGFKCRATINNENTNGNTYVYMAFAEAPFVNSKGVPCNAR